MGAYYQPHLTAAIDITLNLGIIADGQLCTLNAAQLPPVNV